MKNGIEICESVTQRVLLQGHNLWLKRLDLLHPKVGGNKYFKLKYNIEAVLQTTHKTLLTFGGAYSNHIHATAAAGELLGFKTIGVIRGDELDDDKLSATLRFAKNCGMHLEFITRESYSEKHTEDFHAWLREQFGSFHLVPEGGSNFLGINGCMEILSKEDKDNFDIVCCACGTGATLAGIVLSMAPHQRALGFSAHKNGSWLREQVMQHIRTVLVDEDAVLEYKDKFDIVSDYHFGGYARYNESLITFCKQFEYEQNIPLEQVYTGKMMFGINEMIRSQIINQNTRMLVLHTGGLQGRVESLLTSA